MNQVLYFRGLNGLRALAALAVLFAHTTLSLDSFGLDSHVFGTSDDGSPKSTSLAGFGVSIFFSLSGFLITYLLLEEKKLTDVNIRNFYLRRILRIWPLYYLYFALVILTLLFFDLPFNESSILFYFFMLANLPFIFGGQIAFLGHYWSLGVEEQFYSFWPWIVKKSKSILKITILICVLLILLKLTLRYSDILNNQGEVTWAYLVLHVTRFHCMLIGATGAILFFRNNDLFLKLTNNILAQLISWFVIALIAINKFHIISVLDNEIISIITMIIIIGQIQKTNRLINLENLIFNFVGKISYGIYIIHPLVIFYLSKVISFMDKTNVFNYVVTFLSVFFVTIALAYVSYEFYEKRFLRLKDKYTVVKNSGN